MAPKRATRSTPVTTTPAPTATTTTSVTNAQLQAMIDQGVTTALAARDANRNDNDSHTLGTGGRRAERVVKFSTCTLLAGALTWWNSHVMTVSHDAAYAMTWADLRKKMTDKYCLRNEMKKLEAELWNLKVKGTDVIGYNQRFQELALLCVRMFPEESDKIERYVGGLPDMIHGNIVASKPKTMQEAVEMATELMDKKVITIAERQAENKRKFENTSRNNQNQQQQNKRQNTRYNTSYKVMSDSEDSTVTYTVVSSPFKDGSDIGSPGVEGPPIMLEDPYAYIMAAYQVPSLPDYIPGPEEPQSPPPLDIVPELMYPEYIPQEDEILPAKEQPLPAAASPTADSPGYVPESDPKEEPEEDDEDPEEDPADYPADRDDDDDDETRMRMRRRRRSTQLRSTLSHLYTVRDWYESSAADLTETIGGRWAWEFGFEQDMQDIYVVIEDTQDRQTQIYQSVETLFDDSQYHYETARLLDQEALVSQEAWGRSIEAADRMSQVVTSEMLQADHQRQVQLAEALKLLKGLQTQMVEFQRQHATAKVSATRLMHQERLVAVPRFGYGSSSCYCSLLKMAPKRRDNEVKPSATPIPVKDTHTTTSVTNAYKFRQCIIEGLYCMAARDATRNAMIAILHGNGCQKAYEIKKLEFEIVEFEVKRYDVVTYSQRFQELALILTQKKVDDTAGTTQNQQTKQETKPGELYDGGNGD
ncbi:reverse transcriptase domain-containing protein [Tanacetum coccineum]|uniref:Reverse transcriptase domain-containing protein n=1 Tax=Tanacetum coccineum TaxID=301880 RepID=A0ABQ4ZVV6_9ASTR